MNLAAIPSDLLPDICRQLPQCLWLAKNDGFLDYANPFALEYLGVNMEQLRGWNWMQIVHPADREPTMYAWLEAIALAQPLDVRQRMITADGEFHWNLVRAHPIRDDLGRVLLYVGTCTDVEDWKQSLRDLSSANREIEQLLALLDAYERNTPVGMGFLGRELRYVRLNETLAAFNGLPVAAHLGRHIREVNPILWSKIGPELEIVLTTRKPVSDMELTDERDDTPGRGRVWKASYHPVLHADEFLGIAIFVTELTTQRRLEDRLHELIPEVEGHCNRVIPFLDTPSRAY
ncbi:PAS domain-containing protein [Verrucomicrobiota bacterium sgz303538]